MINNQNTDILCNIYLGKKNTPIKNTNEILVLIP